jgi:hypothetical protein
MIRAFKKPMPLYREHMITETNDWLNNNVVYPYQEQLCEERPDPDHIHWVKVETTFIRLFYLTHLDTQSQHYHPLPQIPGSNNPLVQNTR